MLHVDWTRFGNAIKAHAIHDATHLTSIEKRLGLSHARLVNAAQGKPVGTEIFLTLCHWMKQDPMHFCVSPTRNRLDGPPLPTRPIKMGMMG